MIALKRIYRRLTGVKRDTVKVVIEWEGKVLLVRPTYGHKLWTLPGGGRNRGEGLAETATRETREEVAMELESLAFCGTFDQPKTNRVSVFKARSLSGAFIVDEIEITEARWFDPRHVPDGHGPRLLKCLALAGYR